MSELTTAEGRALNERYLSVGEYAPFTEDILAIEAAAAEAERARIRAAVEEIIAVLGPTPPDCGCEGCRVEMQMALDNARAVLAAIDAPGTAPAPDRADPPDNEPDRRYALQMALTEPCTCRPFFSGHVVAHPDCPRGRAEAAALRPSPGTATPDRADV